MSPETRHRVDMALADLACNIIIASLYVSTSIGIVLAKIAKVVAKR